MTWQAPVTLEDYEEAGYYYRLRGIGKYPTQDSHTPDQERAFITGFNRADLEAQVKAHNLEEFDE